MPGEDDAFNERPSEDSAFLFNFGETFDGHYFFGWGEVFGDRAVGCVGEEEEATVVRQEIAWTGVVCSHLLDGHGERDQEVDDEEPSPAGQ